MSTTVHVEGISSQTSEKEVRDFFSFCGKISSLELKPSEAGSQSATVGFEKETAAKTALLLDSTQLGPAQVKVTAADGGAAASKPAAGTEAGKDDLDQEDKPRARIVAEYLAHGYLISDKAIERALALDKTHGISNKFTNALKTFDERTKATDKAAAIDAKFALTDKATAGWRGLNSYFEKAIDTPTGQRIRALYVEGNKQVLDVHNEARHLADLKGAKPTQHTPETVPGTSKTQCNCAAESGKCGCAPGACACADCGKNPEVDNKVDPEKAMLEKVDGGRTKCNCAGAEGKCACKAGECACASCNKNPEVAPGIATGTKATQ